MTASWHPDSPLYRQVHDRVVGGILDGSLAEGAELPSVRRVAAEERINPLTVLKGYQALMDAGFVERRRGQCFVVAAGAPVRLAASERERFLVRDWPRIAARLARLGLSLADLPPPPSSGDTP